MDKNIFFSKLKKIADNEKYISIENDLWKICKDKTITNGNIKITWDKFYDLYANLNGNFKFELENKINYLSKSDDEKNNIFIKILVNLSKKYNFYNILKKQLTPFKINVALKSLYYSSLNRDENRISLINLFNEIKSNTGINCELYRKLSSSDIFLEFSKECYSILKDDIIKYLKENEIYDKLLFYATKNSSFINTFDDYYNFKSKFGFDVTKLIIGNFSWKETVEGYLFWEKKHKSFVNFIFKKITEPL